MQVRFHHKRPGRAGSALLALLATLGLHMPAGAADPLKESLQTNIETQQAGQRSQDRIDQLDEQTRKLLEEYRLVTRKTETLQIYNEQLERLVGSQQEELASLQDQIDTIETTERELVPLMLSMIDNLEAFVEHDLPFLPEERRARIERLRATMDRADVSVSEKFRQIMEAYQIENDYGRTIEAYRAELDTNGESRTVDFLRLGRVGLYYQTLDGGQSGYWDADNERWAALAQTYRRPLAKGLRIARKQAAPDLLSLPVPAAEDGQ